MPSSSSVEDFNRRDSDSVDLPNSKKMKMSSNSDEQLENGNKLLDDLDASASMDAKKLKIEQLRPVLAKVLEHDYKNISVKEFEDMLLVHIADYFANYHPSLQLQRQVINIQRKYNRLEEQFNRVMKHFYDMRYILKRMADQKRSGQPVNELPCRPIRSVAVQVQATRCKGGEFCPGNSTLPHKQPLLDTDVKMGAADSSAQNNRVTPRKQKSTENGPKNTSSPSAETSQSNPASSESAAVIDLTDRDDSHPAGATTNSQSVSSSSSDPSTSVKKSPNKMLKVGNNNAAPKLVIPSSRSPCEEPLPIEKVQLPTPPKSAPYNAQTIRPPQPIVKINKADCNGILLSWTLKGISNSKGEPKVPITWYQVFACQEINEVCKEWSPVGTVKALPLPMACTLSQFREGNRYHFIVRAVDKYNVFGDFSSPASILLRNSNHSV